MWVKVWVKNEISNFLSLSRQITLSLSLSHHNAT